MNPEDIDVLAVALLNIPSQFDAAFDNISLILSLDPDDATRAAVIAILARVGERLAELQAA